MEDNLGGTKYPINMIDEACRRICVRVASLSVWTINVCVCVCVVAVCVPRVSEPGELRQEYEDQVSRVSSVCCACCVPEDKQTCSLGSLM